MNSRVKKFWEIYLVYYALNCAVVVYDFVTDQAEVTPHSIIELLFMALGAYGLYGFIYQKQLVTKLFWQIFCVPFTAVLGYSLFNVVATAEEEYFSVLVAAIFISTLLVVPFTYAIVKYSYFSNRICLKGT